MVPLPITTHMIYFSLSYCLDFARMSDYRGSGRHIFPSTRGDLHMVVAETCLCIISHARLHISISRTSAPVVFVC